MRIRGSLKFIGRAGAVLAGAVLSGSLAASALAATAGAPAKLPDWSGIWMRDGNTNYDPSVKVGDRQRPPLTPEYEKIYQAKLDAAAAGKPIGDPTAACFPSGMPRVIRNPYPFEWVVTPKVVYSLHEQNIAGTRRIFTDGRGHPKDDDLQVTYNGHSIGHWEGDTLVVDTIGINANSVFDSTGIPHSDKIHVKERIRKVGDKMEDQVTVEDPLAFAKPWTITRTYTNHAKEGWEIKEYLCQENNRNVVNAKGETTAVIK
jgi:hypothetical protein